MTDRRKNTEGSAASRRDLLWPLGVIDELRVGQVRVEPRRLSASYTVTRNGESNSTDLAYRYEEPVFDPSSPADVNLGAARDELVRADLSPWHDRAAGRVRSRTGELEWRYREGVVKMASPRLEAGLGFLGAHGPLVLPHLTVRIASEYAAVSLTPLDEYEVGESRRLLLSVMTEVSNTGFRAPGHGLRRIEDPGGPL